MAHPPQTCTKTSLNSAMATCFSTCLHIIFLYLSSSTLWFTYTNPNCHNLNYGVLLGGCGPLWTNALNELTCSFTWLHTLNPRPLLADMPLRTGIGNALSNRHAQSLGCALALFLPCQANTSSIPMHPISWSHSLRALYFESNQL